MRGDARAQELRPGPTAMTHSHSCHPNAPIGSMHSATALLQARSEQRRAPLRCALPHPVHSTQLPGRGRAVCRQAVPIPSGKASSLLAAAPQASDPAAVASTQRHPAHPRIAQALPAAGGCASSSSEGTRRPSHYAYARYAAQPAQISSAGCWLLPREQLGTLLASRQTRRCALTSGVRGGHPCAGWSLWEWVSRPLQAKCRLPVSGLPGK